MEKSKEHHQGAQSTSLKETQAENKTSHNETDSKDSKTDEIDDITKKAIEVNSADEVRQAIKAVLSGKRTHIQNDENDPNNQATGTTSEGVQVGLSQEYKPESGDQLQVPKQDNPRKRRGRPQNAGPSKRVKTVTVEDFYVGKLSNVVNFPSSNRKRPHFSESESDVSDYMNTPYTTNQWLWSSFYK